VGRGRVGARVSTAPIPTQLRNEAAENGVDVRVVKELLGHEDIKSTVVYTQVIDTALNAAVLRLPWSLR
jgi:hypothetical protein